jgi:hypothetical protein
MKQKFLSPTLGTGKSCTINYSKTKKNSYGGWCKTDSGLVSLGKHEYQLLKEPGELIGDHKNSTTASVNTNNHPKITVGQPLKGAA